MHARGPRADRRFVMSASPINPSSSALVLFSGGQDSATCLAWALDRFARVETVGFDYGQRHAVELEARQAVRDGMAARAARTGPTAWAPDHMLDITRLRRASPTAP